LKNISSKPLGLESPSRRLIEARVSTDCSDVHIGPITSNIVDRVDLPVNWLANHDTLNQQLRVRIVPTAQPYEQLPVKVALHFSRPDNNELSLVQYYDLQVQVSDIFHYRPDADLLMITNSQTPSHEVEGWKTLICNTLKLKMDICNVSLEGHFDVMSGDDESLGQNIFKFYEGKPIIMLGNVFPYFDRGQRRAIDLVNEDDIRDALSNGSSLFISQLDQLSAGQDHVPRLFVASSFSKTLEFKTVKKLVAGIVESRAHKDFFRMKFLCFPRKKGPNNNTRCIAKGKRVSDQLAKRLPHLRFVFSWVTATDPGSKSAGTVEVFPCFSFTNTKTLFTSAPSVRQFESLHTFSILISFPFSARLRFLWQELEQNVPNKIFVDAVEYDLVNEMNRFCHVKPGWPDPFPGDQLVSHLTRFQEFCGYDPNRPFSLGSLDRMISVLGILALLADCCMGSWPRSMTFGTRRKALCSGVMMRIETFLKNHYTGTDATLRYSKYVQDKKKHLKRVALPLRKSTFVKEVIGKLGIGIAYISNTTDVFDVEVLGNIELNPRGRLLPAAQKIQRTEDLDHAKEEVMRMS
jgi:hypothetical protein